MKTGLRVAFEWPILGSALRESAAIDNRGYVLSRQQRARVGGDRCRLAL